MNVLEEILARTRAEVERRRHDAPPSPPQDAGPRRPFLDALRRPGLSLIAEHKRRSPSAGPIREDLSLPHVVGAYERGGAAALSVLTESGSFGGSVGDLAGARAASSLPILRKDFIVDRWQVSESAAAGADAILLIVAALAPRELMELHASAADHGLAVLVEVHAQAELELALEAGAQLIGINNRDLTTLAVDPELAFSLAQRVPPGAVTVAESGFSRREQLARLEREGIDAVLIGEALMRADDIEAAVRALLG